MTVSASEGGGGFSGEAVGGGGDLKNILWPLEALSPRERAVFVEYHYWKTHMKVVATSHRISLGRAYEVLYKAEAKVAATRAQEEEKGAGSARGDGD